MAIIKWDEDSFSVKIPSIDAQHHKLFDLINHLHDGITAGETEKVVERLLIDLWNYTQEHFAYEEQLQQKVNYEKYYEHKIMHDILRNQVVDFQQQFIRGEVKIDQELTSFLVKWLLNHIAVDDRDYRAVMLRHQII